MCQHGVCVARRITFTQGMYPRRFWRRPQGRGLHLSMHAWAPNAESIVATEPKRCSKKSRTSEQQLLDPEIGKQRATYTVAYPLQTRYIPLPMCSIGMVSASNRGQQRSRPMQLHVMWVCAKRGPELATSERVREAKSVERNATTPLFGTPAYT